MIPTPPRWGGRSSTPELVEAVAQVQLRRGHVLRSSHVIHGRRELACGVRLAPHPPLGGGLWIGWFAWGGCAVVVVHAPLGACGGRAAVCAAVGRQLGVSGWFVLQRLVSLWPIFALRTLAAPLPVCSLGSGVLRGRLLVGRRGARGWGTRLSDPHFWMI